MGPMIDVQARNWWMLVVRGALGVLVALFGAYTLVDGAFSVVAGIASLGENRRRWAQLLSGMAGIVLGALVFAWPGISALALLSLIAARAIVTGVFEIAAEWMLVQAGLASVPFGALLMVFPGSGATALIWLVGSGSIVIGALLFGLGLRLRAMWADMRAGAGGASRSNPAIA